MTKPRTKAAPTGQGRGGELEQINGHELQHPDTTAAASFLQWLDPAAAEWCFRTFPDVGGGSGRNYTGTLEQHGAALATDNAAGRGVFAVINAGGHKGAEIDRVRAVFADLDGAPLPPVLAGPLLPHIVLESSPGKWHAYWLVQGLPLDQFKGIQLAIAARFNSDASVSDLSRVMRLPGLIHAKGQQFQSRVIEWHDHARFTAAQVVEAFPPVARTSTPATGTGSEAGVVVEDEGTRHADLVSLCARQVLTGAAYESIELLIAGEAARGRWSRDFTDSEIAGAITSAYRKVESGELSRPRDLHEMGLGADLLPAGAIAANDPNGAPPPRFKLTPASELLRTPEPLTWLISDLLLPASTSMIIGDPAAGKSLLVIDWAACISLGRSWQGRKTAAGAVVYLAGEGHHGIARRLKAWSLHHAVELDAAPLLVSSGGTGINEPARFKEVVEAIDHAALTYGTPALVVIDTLHRFLAGDENSAADTAGYFQAVDALRNRYGAHVMTVHHSGHGDKGRARGSSSLRGAVDTDMVLTVSSSVRTLEMPKQKDGAATIDPLHFELEELVLPWRTSEGRAETSVVLTRAASAPAPVKSLPASQRLALDTLQSCGAGPVSLDEWRDAYYAKSPADNAEAKGKAFLRARNQLLADGRINVLNDAYSLPDIADIVGHVPDMSCHV